MNLFERTRHFKTAAPNWAALRALAGAAGGGYGVWEMNHDMDPRARIITSLGGAITGAKILQHPTEALDFAPSANGGVPGAYKTLGIFAGGEAAGQAMDSAAKYNKGLTQELQNSTQNATENAETQNMLQKLGPIALGGAGLLGLGGIAAYLAKKNKGTFAPSSGGGGEASPGKMTVTLPPKGRNQPPTVIELPLSGLKLPKSTLSRINSDTKRQIRGEVDANHLRLAEGGV